MKSIKKNYKKNLFILIKTIKFINKIIIIALLLLFFEYLFLLKKYKLKIK